MMFDDFAQSVHQFWHGYLSWAQEELKSGRGFVTLGTKTFFPSMLIVTSASDGYISELVGVKDTYAGLALKKRKSQSIYRVLGQFDDKHDEPLLPIARGASVLNLTIGRAVDEAKLKERFPFISLYNTRLVADFGSGSLLSFNPGWEAFHIENSVLINTKDQLIRSKGILHLSVFEKSVTKARVSPILTEYVNVKGPLGVPTAHGVYTIQPGSEMRLLLGGQFQNMYLFPELHETSIGEFINSHSEIIEKSFDTNKFLYEKSFDWIEHDGSVSERHINPDIVVRRADGNFDIYDLKTALLERRNITKGERKRCRFIDEIQEGIAQLRNYEWYFSFPKNAEWAKIKYGVSVENPKLILVVGSWENVSKPELEQALRSAPVNLSIIDYDTLVHIFMGTLGSKVSESK